MVAEKFPGMGLKWRLGPAAGNKPGFDPDDFANLDFWNLNFRVTSYGCYDVVHLCDFIN